MANVNRRLKEWKQHSTALDRVIAVATGLSNPEPAATISNEAGVAENTARNHLQRLVELGVLLKTNQNGTMVYEPDPLYTRFRTLQDLLDGHNRDDLIAQKADLQEQIETWKAQFGVDSPDGLREQVKKSSTAARTKEIQETIGKWELLEYRLSIIDEAIEYYGRYTRTR